jgi:hypothetical protein
VVVEEVVQRPEKRPEIKVGKLACSEMRSAHLKGVAENETEILLIYSGSQPTVLERRSRSLHGKVRGGADWRYGRAATVQPVSERA